MIHTVDRSKIAAALARNRKARAQARLFVEINTGGEEQKAGVCRRMPMVSLRTAGRSMG
jgi:uncharacterized pyridoxal phosphate-containing UPF0001 family protein